MLSSGLYKNPHGVGFQEVTFKCTNRSAGPAVVGDVMQLDLGLSEGAGYNDITGGSGPTTPYGQFVHVTAVGALAYPLVVVLEAGADDAVCKVGLVGVFDVNLLATTGTPDAGEIGHAVAAATSLQIDAPGTGGTSRAIGICIETGGDGVLKTFFCGTGLGSH